MTFTPGHKHDLFLSYAHAESAWADAFTKAVREEFYVRTGQQVAFWQDTQNLRVGQKWASEIEEGIRHAAVFLAIVSPIYLNSRWCRQERAIVLEKTLEALKVETFHRFLKVIKTPGPGKAHEELLGVLQDIRFFDPADDYELQVDSPKYTATIRDFVRVIRELLTLLGNKGQELYIAPCEIGMDNERDELIREFKDRGFAVKPEVLLDSDFGKNPIRRAMDKVSHTVFILGGVYDQFTAEQIDVARELGKPVVCWIQPGPNQKDMRERIQDLKELPAGSEILGGRSIRELIPHLLEKVKPRETIDTAAPETGNAVYLNYDATLPEDSRIAARVTGVLRDRDWDVVRNARDGDHERLMRSTNAVLVLRAAHPHPDEWLKSNAMELALADQIYERNPDFSVKALLVPEPARISALARGVPIYSWSDPFSPETLDPFFDKLKKARSAHAGR